MFPTVSDLLHICLKKLMYVHLHSSMGRRRSLAVIAGEDRWPMTKRLEYTLQWATYVSHVNEMMHHKMGNIVSWSSLQIKQRHPNYRKNEQIEIVMSSDGTKILL